MALEEDFPVAANCLSDADPCCVLLAALQGEPRQIEKTRIQELLKLLRREEHITNGRAMEVAEFFEWVFVAAFIENRLVDQSSPEESVSDWLSACDSDDWIKGAAGCLISAAIELASVMDGNAPGNSLLGLPFKAASLIERPTFFENRYLSGITLGFSAALRSLAELCHWLSTRGNARASVECCPGLPGL